MVSALVLSAGFQVHKSYPVVTATRYDEAATAVRDFVGSCPLFTGRDSRAPIISSDPWVSYFVGIALPENPFPPRMSLSHLATAERGTVIVWDSRFSPRLTYRVPLEYLLRRRDLDVRCVAHSSKTQLYAFVKAR